MQKLIDSQRVTGHDIKPPAPEGSLAVLANINPQFANTTLFELLKIRNGVFFDDCLWQIWSVEMILQEYSESKKGIKFCDAMLNSEVYIWQSDSTITNYEGSCVARNMNHFFEHTF